MDLSLNKGECYIPEKVEEYYAIELSAEGSSSISLILRSIVPRNPDLGSLIYGGLIGGLLLSYKFVESVF